MDRTDILYEIQKKLIEDLKGVVDTVKEDYKDKLKNSWVLDQLDGLLEKLQPKSVENVEYSRKDLEGYLTNLIDSKLDKVKEHLPEIKENDLYKFVTFAGNLYELIHKRAELEVSALESKAFSYSNPVDLIDNEFKKSKAFDSKTEHQEWVNEVSKNLGEVFDHIGHLSNLVLSVEGFFAKSKLKGKLVAAKAYLLGKYGINVSFKNLAKDLPVAKEAILKNYDIYESGLMDTRYPSFNLNF